MLKWADENGEFSLKETAHCFSEFYKLRREAGLPDPWLGLTALKVLMSFSPDIRNLSNDLPWNRHVCVIPSMSKYWGATDLKKEPDIFLCTARCLMALSAILLFHGILS